MKQPNQTPPKNFGRLTNYLTTLAHFCLLRFGIKATRLALLEYNFHQPFHPMLVSINQKTQPRVSSKQLFHFFSPIFLLWDCTLVEIEDCPILFEPKSNSFISIEALTSSKPINSTSFTHVHMTSSTSIAISTPRPMTPFLARKYTISSQFWNCLYSRISSLLMWLENKIKKMSRITPIKYCIEYYLHQ